MIDEQFLHKDYDLGDDLGLITFCTPVSYTPVPIISIDNVPSMTPLHTIAHGNGEKR